MTQNEVRMKRAVDLAFRFGGIDGAHHKTWVIDQMVRELIGEEAYVKFVEEYERGEDGPKTYSWDIGVAP